MSFLRHGEIYQVEQRCFDGRGRNHSRARTARLDESPVGYSLAGCSPAEPASASPTGGYFATMAPRLPTSQALLNRNHLNSWSHSRGAPHFESPQRQLRDVSSAASLASFQRKWAGLEPSTCCCRWDLVKQRHQTLVGWT